MFVPPSRPDLKWFATRIEAGPHGVGGRRRVGSQQEKARKDELDAGHQRFSTRDRHARLPKKQTAESHRLFTVFNSSCARGSFCADLGPRASTRPNSHVARGSANRVLRNLFSSTGAQYGWNERDAFERCSGGFWCFAGEAGFAGSCFLIPQGVALGVWQKIADPRGPCNCQGCKLYHELFLVLATLPRRNDMGPPWKRGLSVSRSPHDDRFYWLRSLAPWLQAQLDRIVRKSRTADYSRLLLLLTSPQSKHEIVPISTCLLQNDHRSSAAGRHCFNMQDYKQFFGRPPKNGTECIMIRATSLCRGQVLAMARRCVACAARIGIAHG